MFQSTHPRRVWPASMAQARAAMMFQSTHPRRVWLRYLTSLSNNVCFNPHTHVGCDPMSFESVIIKVGFNPHTHVGCDRIIRAVASAPKSFNPHTHVGCDYQSLGDDYDCQMFQSTHPRRVWLRNIMILYGIISFNPHTHVGCDLCNVNFQVYAVQFQSTHPRRVWHIPLFNCEVYHSVSIHTPT